MPPSMAAKRKEYFYDCYQEQQHFQEAGRLVMAMCLICALAVSASATETADVSGEYRVAFLKEGTTTASYGLRMA